MQSLASTADETTAPASMGRLFLSVFGFAIICSFGTLYYSFPQIAVAVSAEFGWPKSEIYGALTVGLLLSGVGAVPVGMAIDRGHGRLVMAGGSVVAGLLLIAWSQTQSLLYFYAVFGGIGLLQAATLYSAAFAIINKHYNPAEVRDNITTLTLWGGFASTLFIPLIELLMAHMDWRSVLIVLGLINIFVCGGIFMFLPKSDQASQPVPKKTAPDEPKSDGVQWALVQPIFWSLLICFALYSVMAAAFRFHLYPLLIESGQSGENAVFILAVLGPAQVAGRALMKVLRSKSIAYIGITVAAVFPLSFIAFTLFPSYFWVLVIAGVAYGAAAGTITIVKGMAVPEFLTRTSYGTINGIMNTPITVLKAFAPSIAALSWSITGNYTALLVGLIGAGIVMLLSFIAAAVIAKRKSAAKVAT